MHALLYVAAAVTGLWGVAHLFATRGVVAGFGELTPDNRRIRHQTPRRSENPCPKSASTSRAQRLP
jgi:hypothetical protein